MAKAGYNFPMHHPQGSGGFVQRVLGENIHGGLYNGTKYRIKATAEPAACLPESPEISAGTLRKHFCHRLGKSPGAWRSDGAKGSGRSIDSYHMFEEMNKCKHLFTRFGGHKLAAGLSLEKENIELFRKSINECCTLTENDLYEKVSIDMQLPFACITEKFVEELSLLEPFGKSNAKPVFAERNVEILSAKRIGKNQNMLKMQVKDQSGTCIDALYFGDAEEFLNRVSEKYGNIQTQNLFRGKGDRVCMSFTYYPGINEYMGNKTPQIIITHYQ